MIQMHLKVINPNSTASMTAKIGECARAAAGPGVTVEATNPRQGPVAIESHADAALAVPGVRNLRRAEVPAAEPGEEVRTSPTGV